jgi:hypothetical protein
MLVLVLVLVPAVWVRGLCGLPVLLVLLLACLMPILAGWVLAYFLVLGCLLGPTLVSGQRLLVCVAMPINVFVLF